nr:uncharacterized protein LOC102132758 [Macaca fascicularis]
MSRTPQRLSHQDPEPEVLTFSLPGPRGYLPSAPALSCPLSLSRRFFFWLGDHQLPAGRDNGPSIHLASRPWLSHASPETRLQGVPDACSQVYRQGEAESQRTPEPALQLTPCQPHCPHCPGAGNPLPTVSPGIVTTPQPPRELLTLEKHSQGPGDSKLGWPPSRMCPHPGGKAQSAASLILITTSPTPTWWSSGIIGGCESRCTRMLNSSTASSSCQVLSSFLLTGAVAAPVLARGPATSAGQLGDSPGPPRGHQRRGGASNKLGDGTSSSTDHQFPARP